MGLVKIGTEPGQFLSQIATGQRITDDRASEAVRTL